MNKVLLIIIVLIIAGGILFSTQDSKKNNPQKNNEKTEQTKPSASETNTHSDAPYSDGISLTITNPGNNATVITSTIIVNGQTSPGADVFINDIEIRANGAGDFSTQITLDEGENNIIIAVNDSEGNSAEKEITVTYTPQTE